jgi:hypothetical protein
MFKMDQYIVEPPVVSEEMFRLRTDKMSPAAEDLAKVKVEDSKYAA